MASEILFLMRSEPAGPWGPVAPPVPGRGADGALAGPGSTLGVTARGGVLDDAAPAPPGVAVPAPLVASEILFRMRSEPGAPWGPGLPPVPGRGATEAAPGDAVPGWNAGPGPVLTLTGGEDDLVDMGGGVCGMGPGVVIPGAEGCMDGDMDLMGAGDCMAGAMGLVGAVGCMGPGLFIMGAEGCMAGDMGLMGAEGCMAGAMGLVGGAMGLMGCGVITGAGMGRDMGTF